MADPSILFVKPRAISSRDKKTLQTAGVIVIEIENPADAKFVRAYAELSSTDMLMAAAEAINDCGYQSVKAAFSEAIYAALRAAATRQETTDG